MKFLLITLILSAIALNAQPTAFPDNVPRDRLTTDAELFKLIDPGHPQLGHILKSWQNGDGNAALEQLNQYLLQRNNRRYFFSSASLKPRMDSFRKAYAAQAAAISKRADAFMKQYGPDLVWKQPGADLQGTPHTANTIRYLARQARATDIALSFYLTNNDTRYDRFLIEQIQDFVKDYQAGETQTGRNRVFERFYAGHRLRNWLFANQLLASHSAAFQESQVYMLKTFLMHGARLIDDCINFHWGNHQLHGLAGLYEMTMMYPELPVMQYWNREALRVIMLHIEREVKADGFQFERASHYFKLDIVNYFRIYQISNLNNVKLPDLYMQRFQEMFEAIIKLARPDLTLPVMQDAQAPNLDHDAAELADQGVDLFMSLGAATFNQPRYNFFATANFPSDFYWFFPEQELTQYRKLGREAPSLQSVALDSSLYYVMRAGWHQNDYYLLIDAGLAKYKPDHTHGGILGLTGFANGAEILPSYRVRYNDPSYRTMKNSLVKSVALADRQLQGQEWISNHARTGFGIWDRLPKPSDQQWMTGQHFDYFSASHNGFQDLGVEYRRSVIFMKPIGWLVVDDFRSAKPHNYQQIWQGQFDFDDQYNHAQSKSGPPVYILQADPSRMEISNKVHFDTYSIEFEKRGVRDYRFLTLLMPGNESPGEPDIRLFERENYQQVVVYAGEYRFSIYFKKQNEFQLDEIDTDAEMVVVGYKSEKMTAALLYNGSHLSMDGISIREDKLINREIILDK